jgi:hypothetical protein
MVFLSVTESIKLRRIVGVAEGLPTLMNAGDSVGSQIIAAVVDVLAYGIGGGILVAVSVYLLSSVFDAALSKRARPLLRIFLLPGLVVMPIVFGYIATHNLTLLYFGIFAIGALTVGQFSFWGNYLPRVYPTHLRGTGESFAANIGGRMIGTAFAMVTSQLSLVMPAGEGAPTPAVADALKVAAAAALVGTAVYLVNLLLSFWLPEPQHEELPE